MLFFGIVDVSNQCKIRHDWPSDTRRSIGQCDRPIIQPGSISAFNATFCLVRDLIFYLTVYTINLCKKADWVCSFCKGSGYRYTCGSWNKKTYQYTTCDV